MSDTKSVVPTTDNPLSEEQLQSIGGGDCSVSEWLKVTQEFTAAYENLVDFASHVMERVSNGITN